MHHTGARVLCRGQGCLRGHSAESVPLSAGPSRRSTYLLCVRSDSYCAYGAHGVISLRPQPLLDITELTLAKGMRTHHYIFGMIHTSASWQPHYFCNMFVRRPRWTSLS